MLAWSGHIQLDALPPKAHFEPTTSHRGRAAVLETLLPELAASPKYTALHRIDCYMLEEANQVLSILLNAMVNADTANLAIGDRAELWQHNSFHAVGQTQRKQVDDMLAWLLPNFQTLTFSQACLEYAECYAKDKQQANQRYDFLQRDGQIESRLLVRVAQQHISLTWAVETPVARYFVASQTKPLEA